MTEHEMKECEKCDKLTEVKELSEVEGKMVCKNCTTTKKLN